MNIDNFKVKIGDKVHSLKEFIELVKNPLKAASSFGDSRIGELIREGKQTARALFSGRYDVECYGADGTLKWKDYIDNIVVNVALEHILDILFVSATTQLDPWYVGLVNASSAGESYAAGDTMASHAGWAEDTAYDEATRQEFIDVRSGQSVDNSASKAVFTMSATTTIAGAFMASDNTKGGSSGTLLSAGNFTGGDRSVVDNDTLNVTYTITAADDGV